MYKNILILSTSPRKGGNSEALADAFAEGAREAGHNAEKICLYDKNIQFCKGCLACQKTQKCVIQDDANAIVERMIRADVVVFATPIYFYEMSGQMKTLLDRTNPAFATQYKFRDIYLLATAADSNEASMDGAIKGLAGWIACFAGARLAGVVRGLGVDVIGSIQGTPAPLKQSYDRGRTICGSLQ